MIKILTHIAFDLATMEMNNMRLSGLHSQQSEFSSCNSPIGPIGALSASRVKNPNFIAAHATVKDGEFLEFTPRHICVASESLLTSHSVLSTSKMALISNPHAGLSLRGRHGVLKDLLLPHIVHLRDLQSLSPQKIILARNQALLVLISKLLMREHILHLIRRQ